MQLFDIDIYSHGFSIRIRYPNERDVMMRFCQSLTIYEMVWIPKVRRKVRKPKTVFATATPDRREFGFLIGDLEPLLTYLRQNGYRDEQWTIQHHRPSTGVPVDINVSEGVGPRDEEQRKALAFNTQDRPIRVMPLRTGGGKELPLDAPIKVPGGWKFMGEMSVGDKVTSRDGTSTTVTGVFPQGKKQLYLLTFSDGREVEAGLEHQWYVYSFMNRRNATGGWMVVTTDDLIKMKANGDRIYLPLCESEQSPDVDLPVDPYLLGVLLGDGRISRTVSITKNDDFIFNELDPALLAMDMRRVPSRVGKDRVRTDRLQNINHGEENVLRTELIKLGLEGTRSWEKFIPKIYLNGSTEQRVALLQGLMDTDGYVDVKSTCSFTSTSFDLAKGVQYLVRSLGGMARISTRYTFYTYKGERRRGRPSHRVTIRVKTPSMLFRLPRKLERTNDDHQYCKGLKLRLTSIEMGRIAEAQCIAVDHPERLYITKDFTVTHNTATGLMTVAHWRVRTALIMSAGYINNWLKSIEWVLDVKKSDVVVVKGRKQLVTLVELALANQLEYKIIFLSINTLRDFLTDHLKEGYTINGVTPRMLFSTLGIGFRIIDESHENVHAVVRNTIHTHVNRTLYLSATIVSDNPMINERYDKIFPYEDRFKEGVNNDHCIGYWVHYDLASMDKIKYQGPRGYSHMLFEQSIRKDPKRLERFIELHVRYIDQYFLDDYLPGQKCLVFCAEVEMCEVLAAALKAVYRKRDLTVTSYTAKEDEEILYTHDIVVSTPGSAGTGKDIRNLKTGVTALNIDSTQKNLQMIGRFRVMHDFPDIHPRFIFMSCRSVDRQMEYGSRKMEYLQPHTHDLVVVDSGFTI